MRTIWSTRAWQWAIALAIVLAAPASAGQAPTTTTRIQVAGMSFLPGQVSVRVGDTIEWTNGDVVDHTTTETKTALWNVSVAPGKSAKVLMKKPGTYDYYCRYHPNMVARVVVSPRRPTAGR